MSEEWTGEERRSNERRQLDILTEFAAIRESLQGVSSAVTRAFPEQRVREIIASEVATEQRRGRRLFLAWILGPILAAFLFIYLEGRNDAVTLKEAAVTANYVRDCLQHPERLSSDERMERCGPQSSGTSAAVVLLHRSLIEFEKCALALDHPARTGPAMDVCVAQSNVVLRGER